VGRGKKRGAGGTRVGLDLREPGPGRKRAVNRLPEGLGHGGRK